MAPGIRRARRRQQAPGWVWMLVGLTLGLVVALGVYLQSSGDRQRVAARPAAPAEPAPAPSADVSSEPSSITPPAETRFDFYELLPQFEVVIPEVESDTRPDRAARAVEVPGRYVLQVGSFTALADADRMQASLALLGIESRIQRVTIDDDVYHRVRIGPIAELDRLNRVRRQLRDARIESLLMRVPE